VGVTGQGRCVRSVSIECEGRYAYRRCGAGGGVVGMCGMAATASRCSGLGRFGCVRAIGARIWPFEAASAVTGRAAAGGRLRACGRVGERTGFVRMPRCDRVSCRTFWARAMKVSWREWRHRMETSQVPVIYGGLSGPRPRVPARRRSVTFTCASSAGYLRARTSRPAAGAARVQPCERRAGRTPRRPA
jgi:hypothetical protein